MDSFRIACYHMRDGKLNTYGVDSPINGYSYFYEKLLDWTIEKMNNQENHWPLESISELLKNANYPKQAIISVGATRYTEFWENTFLEKDDEVFVVLYNSEKYSLEEIEKLLENKNFPSEDISLLYQKVD